jgi:hypothetical protein
MGFKFSGFARYIDKKFHGVARGPLQHQLKKHSSSVLTLKSDIYPHSEVDRNALKNTARLPVKTARDGGNPCSGSCDS